MGKKKSYVVSGIPTLLLILTRPIYDIPSHRALCFSFHCFLCTEYNLTFQNTWGRGLTKVYVTCVEKIAYPNYPYWSQSQININKHWFNQGGAAVPKCTFFYTFWNYYPPPSPKFKVAWKPAHCGDGYENWIHTSVDCSSHFSPSCNKNNYCNLHFHHVERQIYPSNCMGSEWGSPVNI